MHFSKALRARLRSICPSGTCSGLKLWTALLYHFMANAKRHLQGFRIEDRIIRVMNERFALQPGSPPEQSFLPEADGGYRLRS